MGSQMPDAPYSYRPSSIPPAPFLEILEGRRTLVDAVPSELRGEASASLEEHDEERISGHHPAGTASSLEVASGSAALRAPRPVQLRPTRERAARKTPEHLHERRVTELWLTFIVTSQLTFQVRMRADLAKSVIMTLLATPLVALLSGFGLRGAYEFPEIRAMAHNVASGLPTKSAASFSVVPTLEHTAWSQRPSSRAEALGLGSAAVASELLAARPRQAWVQAANELAQPENTIDWPVPDGWFVRGYGSGEGGYHRAVDVAAEIGSDVVAVGPGIVGYVGNQIRGYGNIVLLVHPEGVVTLYAHNSKNLVEVGQAVHRGELIAQVGSTGISKGPHVHFEMLYEGKNCDPLRLFRPFARHRNGDASEVAQLTWTPGTPRPTGVSCGRRMRHPSHSNEAETH